MGSNNLVRDRPAGHRDRHHLPLRRIDGLADRFRDFVRLARGEPDLPLAVADGDERVEGKPASALHDLDDPVDRNDVLDQRTLLAPAIQATTAPIPPTAAFAAPATLATGSAALTTAATAAAARAAPSAATAATATGAAATTATA